MVSHSINVFLYMINRCNFLITCMMISQTTNFNFKRQWHFFFLILEYAYTGYRRTWTLSMYTKTFPRFMMMWTHNKIAFYDIIIKNIHNGKFIKHSNYGKNTWDSYMLESFGNKGTLWYPQVTPAYPKL